MKRNNGNTTATPLATVDWHAIHHRLEAARAAVERGEILSPENARAVLRSRAMELAREPQSARQHDDTFEVIEFVVANETYAVESQHVREVFPLKELTPVPGMPVHVLGIVNVRGRILFVIDIKKFFGLPERGITDLNRIVILQADDAELGILADVIVGTRTIALQDLQVSLPTLTEIREEYLKGIGLDRAVVLDAARLLADPSILAQEQVHL